MPHHPQSGPNAATPNDSLDSTLRVLYPSMYQDEPEYGTDEASGQSRSDARFAEFYAREKDYWE